MRLKRTEKLEQTNSNLKPGCFKARKQKQNKTMFISLGKECDSALAQSNFQSVVPLRSNVTSK